MTALALTALLLLAACDGGGGETDGQPTATGTAGTDRNTPLPPAGGVEGANVTPPALTPGTGEGPEPEGAIVFLSFRDANSEIYSINVDGSGLKNLSNDPGVDENPDVSPDGKQIVWTSDRGEGGTLHLFVMDVDGSHLRQLTSGPGGDISPRWSPDGKKVAFSRGGSMLVVDAQGGEPEFIFQSDDEATAAPCRAGAFPGGWSPDGVRIAYYSASASRGIGEVCTINADGSGITVVVGEPPVYNVEPAWSRDGRYLAFRSIRGRNHDVYVFDLETGRERRLTDDPALDLEPSWSPDGEWIVFGSGRDNEFLDIFIMRKDGSDVRRVTTDPEKESEPVWAP